MLNNSIRRMNNLNTKARKVIIRKEQTKVDCSQTRLCRSWNDVNKETVTEKTEKRERKTELLNGPHPIDCIHKFVYTHS